MSLTSIIFPEESHKHNATFRPPDRFAKAIGVKSLHWSEINVHRKDRDLSEIARPLFA